MPVHYHVDVKEERLDAVVDAIDAVAAGPGYVEIGTGLPPAAFGTLLATIPLQKPSFTVATSGTDASMTMDGVPLSTAAGGAVANGTAQQGRICDNAAKVIVGGLTVGVGAGFEINLNSAAISTGQTVTLSSGTITHG